MSNRVKCLQYQWGSLVEIDLGPAPAGIPSDTTFNYVHEGHTYRHCYVESENDDEFVFSFWRMLSWAALISFAGIGAVITFIHVVTSP